MILDRGSSPDVLPSLLENNKKIAALNEQNKNRREGFRSGEYGGKKIYGLCRRRGPSLWATESNGKLVIGSDRLAIQSFILRAADLETATVATRRKWKPGTVLRADCHTPTALNQFLTMVRGRNREELAAVSAFFDFPAWKELSLTLSKSRLEVAVQLDPSSELVKVLEQPAKSSALVSLLPNDTDLAFVVGLKQPAKLLKHIESGIATTQAARGRPERGSGLAQEFRKEVGLDLEKDIANNITEAAFVVPQFERERDLERRFVLMGQANDAETAATVINTLVTHMARNDALPVIKYNGVKVWGNDAVKIAIGGKMAMLSATRRDTSAFDSVLKQLQDGPSTLGAKLLQRYPSARSYGVFNPAILFKGKDPGTITSGLTFRENTLSLRADFDIAGFATILLDTARIARQQALKAASANNLRQIATACAKYLNDYGKYATGFDAMQTYIPNKAVLMSPLSRKPYIYNNAIGGKQIGTITNRGKTVLAHEPQEGAMDGGHVVFLDGTVVWLPAESLKSTLQSPGPHMGTR